MTRITTASRLHFGLLSLSAAAAWPDRQGQPVVPSRRFGGVGLMVQRPAIAVSVQPASAWSAVGPLAERALLFAQRFAATLPAEQLQPLRIMVESAAPEHCGLGVGTQLALAVGRAIATVHGLANLEATELARRVGRGERSALGTHGFAQGGFLVEGGKSRETAVAPLLFRCDFPEAWRVVLTFPTWAQGLHGARERAAFQQLTEQGLPPTTTDTLCRLVLLGLLPSLAEGDLSAFSEALYDFNARVGDIFATAQGGTYAHPRLAEVVAFIRQQGVSGVGQSSWGATLFAITEDEKRAANLVEQLRDQFGLTAAEVCVTAAANRGAVLSTLSI